MSNGNAADRSADTEHTIYEPSEDFAENSHIASLAAYKKLHRRSLDEPEAFWREISDGFTWSKPWTILNEWNEPFTRWFVDGELNITVNLLDRHVEAGQGDRVAYHWEGEPGDTRVITYSQLLEDVSTFANGLRSLGLGQGDRIILYMPMIPELPIAMLACARLGIVHSVIFGGFSADAIRDRVQDAGARAIIASDGSWRRGKIIPLKDNVDNALAGDTCPTVEHVVIYKRCANEISFQQDRDIWWHDLIAGQSNTCEPVMVSAEHPLYVLYTSGTTGKPKGVVHATAGYMVYTALTAKWVFDLKDDDVYWCTADIGWVTGHSYIVYGILANGVTSVMYEGAPDYPDFGRVWDIVEKYRVTLFYTAPTAIRAFIKWGDDWPSNRNLSTLRLLGTVGEPINPEVWRWYSRVIGDDRCPIVDTWWQTETGGIMITPLPGAIGTKAGSATLPFPGIEADVVDEEGNSVDPNERGLLVIRRPWPSMIRGIFQEGWGEPGHPGEFGERDRFFSTYFQRISGCYLAGDAVTRDEDGYYWIIGRIDDVLNVSGHRIGTAELESSLVEHAAVAEAAVIGYPDELTGEAVAAFVTLRGDFQGNTSLQTELINHIGIRIGRFARPKMLRFTPALPKTRSGKIMRRLLKELATDGKVTGDTTTLEDITAIAALSGDDGE